MYVGIEIDMTLKILICVLYSEGPEYAKMYQATRWYYTQFSHIRVLYYCFREKQETEYALDTETDILYIRGTENMIPGILQKTIKTFQYITDKNAFGWDYDYVLRTNISTLVNIPFFTDALCQMESDYGTAKANCIANDYRDVSSGLDSHKYTGVIYPFGASYYLSTQFLRVLLTKIERLEYNLLDDIALGHYIDRYFPNTRMVCLSEHLIDVKENNLSALNYTQIMFYRHKTACRQHDVAHIKHIIRMLSLGEYKEHSPLLRIKLLSLSQLVARPTRNQGTIYACVARYDKNTDWTARLWNVSRVLVYDKENPNNPYNVPVNKGNEASAYLKYIIDHYDCLPDFTFFVHDEEFAWHHSGSVVDKLTEAVESGEKFYNINDRCILGSILTNDWYPFVLDWYRDYVDKYIPLSSLPHPDWTLGYRGSAQFLVHKSRILGLPIAFYRGLYEWIITTEAPSCITGRCLEWTWHLFWEKYPYMKQS